MNTAHASSKIIQFPNIRSWSQIAKRYVDYMTSGDPRAAVYYLGYELKSLNLSDNPTGLRNAIDKEFKRRGFPGPIRFHKGG